MASPSTTVLPIVDSHIHLYPASEVSTLAWCKPGNPIGHQQSVDDYVLATSTHSSLRGFIFLETDRIHDLDAGLRDGSGWQYPLMEVSWLRRIANGTPRPGEGHSASQAPLCLAIVPWAPLPSGAEALERYTAMVRETAGEETWAKVRGFRYLVQYKPRGVMLTKEFIEGLKWMGTRGLAFDVGIDNHRDGQWALEECEDMIARAHEGVGEPSMVTFILNHLCKPDMTLSAQGNITKNNAFITWRDAMSRLSKYNKTYMKLSGCFSEIPAEYHDAPEEKLYQAIEPWLKVVLDTFGPSRMMFGSDWPVCTIGVAPQAWEKWRWIVQKMCQVSNLSQEEELMIWSGTAINAYGLKDLMP